MTVQPSATARRARLLLLSVLSVAALLCGIVAMHAQLAGVDAPSDTPMGAAAMTSHTADGVAPSTAAVAAIDLMQHGMGGMGAMD